MPPPYHGGYTHPWYTSHPTPLGTPPSIHPAAVFSAAASVGSGCVAKKPWAQEGRKPWVRAEERLKVVIPVRVDGRCLRRVTPLFLVKREQRLDRHRVTLRISPMVRSCCARWPSLLCTRSVMHGGENYAQSWSTMCNTLPTMGL